MSGKIRLATERDAESVAAIYAPYVNDTTISFEITAPSPNDFETRIRNGLKVAPWLVYVLENKIVAYAYASKHREREAYQWSADVSVYVAQDFQKQGIGTKLYAKLFQMITDMGYCNAFAGITLPNVGSIKLHESMGFKPIGVYKSVGFKHGGWHDVGWWQKNLIDTNSAPRKIRLFEPL